MKGKTKTQKGITLVALIITIVVLLILAVVAITAVQNDSIIEYANNSVTGYKDAQIDERTELGSYESFINTYKPGENGSSLEDAEEMDLVERYVLGAEKTGRLITEIANVDFATVTVTSYIGEESTIKDANTSMKFLFLEANETGTKVFSYTKYNNKVYKFVVDATTYVTEDVELVYKPEGREGQTVKYDSDGDSTTPAEDWIVLTDRNGLLEIISEEPMGELTLGAEDTEIKNNLLKYLDLNNDGTPDDLDGDGFIEEDGKDLDGDVFVESDIDDIAIASYNNAITTINNYCKSLIKSTDNDGVRSIGASTDTAGNYSSTNFDSWFKNKDTVKVKAGDENYKDDLEKLEWLELINGIDETNFGYFWIASRIVYDGNGYVNVDFCVELLNDTTLQSGTLMFEVTSTGVSSGAPKVCAVRPVVINPVLD